MTIAELQIRYLCGELRAVGHPTHEDADRALVLCTPDQIRRVKYLPMFKEVALVPVEELLRLLVAKEETGKPPTVPASGKAVGLEDMEQYLIAIRDKAAIIANVGAEEADRFVARKIIVLCEKSLR